MADTQNHSHPELAPHEKQNNTSEEVARDVEKSRSPSPDAGSKASPRQMKQISWVLVLISILSAVFLFALDNTVVADIQPKIINVFGEVSKLPWASVAFALGAVAVNLFWGKLFGDFDGKILFVVAFILFEAGSAVCGAAPSMNALIIGRAICGVGGAGIYIGAMNLLSNMTSEQERPGILSLVGLMWGLGTVLGPIVGGAFADSKATWRWAFYINLVIGALAAPVYVFLIPSQAPNPSVPFKTRLGNLDWVGAIVVAGAFLSGTMAIAFGGAVYDWNSGQTIGMFVTSGVLLIFFAVQQSLKFFTNEEHRLFPVQFVLNYEMCILFAQVAASVTCAFIPTYFIPLFFQFARDDGALEAGVRLLPFVLIMVSTVVFNGILMGKTGYYMPWFLVGSIIAIIGSALMYTVKLDTTAGKIYGYSIILAFGTGCFSQAPFPVAQAKVPKDQVVQATAFIGCGQLIGIVLALTISNTIFINQATIKIADILPGTPRAVIQLAVTGASGEFFKSLSDAVRVEILKAIVSAISYAYVMTLAGAALAAVLAIFMKREKLFIQGGAGGA
ncbi:MFS general substrate transporter [Amniculicola lignicola CBS 123094]|uniref:MFS general substrate transporter n=1 Tax=Amniculicola lignicola CBS 123094 TaxID=1392246 RepID=A0A6A5WJJ3_9PLEO|nr:MFS general substrate transporter [Amniculicola lignicola CBS 123094]